MSPQIYIGIVVVLVLTLVWLWYIEVSLGYLVLVLVLLSGCTVAIASLDVKQKPVLGGGWWCFAPTKPLGDRCIGVPNVGVNDRNVCETSCSLSSERIPTVANLRKFILDRGMKFPLGDTFLKILDNPQSDYAKGFKKFKNTRHYRYMTDLFNIPDAYNHIMKKYCSDIGVKFIGELRYVVIKKDSQYHKNLIKVIADLETRKASMFGWWTGYDDIMLDYLKSLDTKINTTGETWETMGLLSSFIEINHLITGASPERSKSIVKWFKNGFTGRTGVEVFFTDRIGKDPHRQVMVVDHDKKTIFYFEPNIGIGDTLLKSIFKMIFVAAGCQYQIIDMEWENCPRAFQAVDRSDGIEDIYCQTWSIFIAITFAMNYPKFTKEQIFGWMVSLGDKSLDILFMFMYKLHITDGKYFMTDEISLNRRNLTVSMVKLWKTKMSIIMDRAPNGAPRAVRDSIKPCRNMLRAIVDSAYDGFGNMPEGGIMLNQIHYFDVIKDIGNTIENQLIPEYQQMITDRNSQCDVGKFAQIVTELISHLSANYIDTGKFGNLLHDNLNYAINRN